jgi:DNA-binding NtrC family response regulator
MEATTTNRSWAALVVDELAESRRMLGDRLVRVGFDLSYAEDGLVALRAFERCSPDVILMGRKVPRLDGVGLVRRIREVSDVPVVMIAVTVSVSDCEEAMRAGANRYLDFGRDLDRVASVACELVARRTSSLPNLLNRRSITAAEARSHAKRELRRELETLLVECRGNIAEMARRMGKDRSTIRYHLRRLGMLDEESPARTDARTDAQTDAQSETSGGISAEVIV